MKNKIFVCLLLVLILPILAEAYGGGGGGSIFTVSTRSKNKAFSNVISKGTYKSWMVQTLEPSQPKTLAVNNDKLPLENIGVSTNKEIINADFFIAEVEEAKIEKIEDKDIYSYFAIISSVSNDDLNIVTLEFHVTDEWLNSVGKSIEQVSLYHEINDSWIQEKTVYINSMDGKHYYSAIIDKLSNFAIGVSGEKAPELKADTEEPAEPEIEPVVEQTDTEDDAEPEQVSAPAPQEEPAESKTESDTNASIVFGSLKVIDTPDEPESSNTLIVVIMSIIAVALIIVSIYWHYKDKKKMKDEEAQENLI